RHGAPKIGEWLGMAVAVHQGVGGVCSGKPTFSSAGSVPVGGVSSGKPTFWQIAGTDPVADDPVADLAAVADRWFSSVSDT
ncbi:MAG: hypothetical protein V4633_19760, partial [Pseudomonadota bacterium]